MSTEATKMTNQEQEMVHLTINNIPLAVPKGTKIMQAAQKLGIDIPHLCYHEDQRIKARCRLCSVEVVGKRRAMLTSLSHRSVPDLCEMAVVANATGMMPDRPLFHAPVARIDEMPDLFCPKADGGLFDAPGRLDIFNCFRRPDEASMAGGVFIVVECKDKKSWQVLKAKGHPCSRNDRYAALYHPAHLLGVETGTSVLAAALMKHATGGGNLRPLCDLCGRAVRDLPKGTVLDMGGHHHTIDGVEGVLNPAAAIGPDAALPFYLLSHRTRKRKRNRYAGIHQ